LRNDIVGLPVVGQITLRKSEKIRFVQSCPEKYSCSDFRKIMVLWRLSRLDEEGRSANRHQTWRRDAMDAQVSHDE
jgi:hypothetical protein